MLEIRRFDAKKTPVVLNGIYEHQTEPQFIIVGQIRNAATSNGGFVVFDLHNGSVSCDWDKERLERFLEPYRYHPKAILEVER